MPIRDTAPLPHRHSCPLCGWKSDFNFRGWVCNHCATSQHVARFNTFQHGGHCPECHVRFTYTTCLACNNLFPYEEWVAPHYKTYAFVDIDP